MRVLASITVLLFMTLAFASYGEDPNGNIAAHFGPEDALYKSPIHVALTHDGTRLFVVCHNSNSVQMVDPHERKVLGEITVGRRPYGIALSPDEQRAYVTNSWDDTLSVIDLKTFEVVETIGAGADPHGVVVDRSGKNLYVANIYSSTLSIISTEKAETIKQLKTGAKPLEVAMSPDGRYVYVSNLITGEVGFREPPESEVTIIDTELQIVVDRRLMPSTNISQGIAVSPDGQLVFVALEIPKNLIPETQIYQGWMVTYGVAVLEAKPGGRVAYLLLDEMDLYYADPFGLIFSPDGQHLYVTSSGVDTVSVLDVAEIKRILKIENGRISVPDETISQFARHLGLSSEFVDARIPTQFNPKGLVASSDGALVYVANRLSDSITIIDAEDQAVIGQIDLGGPQVTTTVRRGEYLFNHAVISFQRQLSCITCHPENNVDGLLYDIAVDGGLGGNLVDNRTLRGVAHTGPFKWSGKNPTLLRQEGPRAAQLFFRSHGFTGDDQHAVVAFIESTPLYPNRHQAADGHLNPAQERGKVIFERSQTNDGKYIPIGNRCVTCHPAPHHTGLQMNDVGTKAYFDTEGEFDTPQLTGIFMTPPYLHDGRCWSLEEIWTLYNPYDLHGVANDLTKQQLNDLIEYLKTL